MANQKERQRFSWTGMGVILILAAITYYLVQSRNLLVLYTLATTLLVALLVAVAFDLGLRKSEGPFIQEEPEEAEVPVVEPAPKLKRRKRRR